MLRIFTWHQEGLANDFLARVGVEGARAALHYFSFLNHYPFFNRNNRKNSYMNIKLALPGPTSYLSTFEDE